MARTRSAAVVVAVALVASAGLAGCGLSQGTVMCSMAPGPTNPVEVTRYRAYGAVVVVGTVGERVGRTRTFTPGYRTDVHAVDVERVVAIIPGPDSSDAPLTAPDVGAADIPPGSSVAIGARGSPSRQPVPHPDATGCREGASKSPTATGPRAGRGRRGP